MPQFARPDQDTTIGSYTDAGGGTTNIFQSIDETSANDSDFVRSPQSPNNSVYVARLSDVVDPVSSSGHIMRMRTGNDVGAGGETIDYTLQLRQGYTNEGSQGTLIATLSRTGVTTTTFTDSSYTLSGGEADSITDYTALYYRLIIDVQ